MPDFSISSDTRTLIVPGLHGSWPAHLQTRWEKRYPFFERVVRADWKNPDLDRWAAVIGSYLNYAAAPTLIVAHSFGCFATVHCLASLPLAGKAKAVGVLLVAPADPHKFGVAHRLKFSRLRCISIVVANDNYPWMSMLPAMHFADTWGSDFMGAGAVGHINGELDLEDWEAGLEILSDLACKATVVAMQLCELSR